MIAWSIQAALDSSCFDRIIVSTDDVEIAEVARIYGADTPFLRPAELSDDHAGTIPVVAHAIDWLNSNGSFSNKVCCIYATAPFVLAADLQKGLSILKSTGADYAFSVTSFPFPIQRAVRINKENRVEMFQPEYLNSRSQDLEEAWHDAGQFYWGIAQAWLECRPILNQNSAPIIMPRFRVQDVDTEEDWQSAEYMYQTILNQNKFKLC